MIQPLFQSAFWYSSCLSSSVIADSHGKNFDKYLTTAHLPMHAKNPSKYFWSDSFQWAVAGTSSGSRNTRRPLSVSGWLRMQTQHPFISQIIAYCSNLCRVVSSFHIVITHMLGSCLQ